MENVPVVPFPVAVRTWWLISLQTFGGPAGQIAVMHRALVDDRRWLDDKRFLHALNFCMVLPGPEAQQLATYLGWLMHGTRGGLVAGGLFVLPGAVAMLLLAALYVTVGTTTVVTGLFAGLAAAVLAVVAQAVVRVARRALTRPALAVIAGFAFVAIALVGVPFPVVVLGAAVAGLVTGTPRRPSAVGGTSAATDEPATGSAGPSEPVPVSSAAPTPGQAPVGKPVPGTDHAGGWHRSVRLVAVGLVAWGLPVAVAATVTGAGSTVTTMGTFFSGAAVVTFGGAYAVLAYVAQRAVEGYGWLSPIDMVRGLALAETTPGPLIMVVQFVAFVGAFRSPGSLDPWVAAIVAALLVTWVTFVPSFLFVLLGAPYVERLRGRPRLDAALGGVTAAVVGVIAALACYLTVTTLFAGRTTIGAVALPWPLWWTARPVEFVVLLIAAVLLFVRRWAVLPVLGIGATLGLLAAVTGLGM